MSSACAREDLATRRIASLLWGLPAVALVIGSLLDRTPRTAVWTMAFLVAGVSCVANASRCGRLHCYFTGPLYLLAAVITVLIGLDWVMLAPSWVAAGAVVGTIVAYIPEWIRGRYVETRGVPEVTMRSEKDQMT